jgi:enamine deaminase RidA (YjgF/YER057c/UK114 family)
LAVIGNYVYLFGGNSASGFLSTIYRTPVSNPLAWVDTGANLPIKMTSATIAQIGDYVYIFGAPGVANTYRAPISNPTVWTNVGTTMPAANVTGSQAVVIGDYLYLFGAPTYNFIYRTPITSNASAFDKNWIYRPNVSAGPWFQATSTNNNLSYLSGNVGVGSTSPFALLSLFANNSTTTGSIVAPATLFAIGSTTGAATSTLFSVSNTGAASTTQLFGAGLASCSGSSALTWSSGLFGCTNVGAAAFPFTPTTASGNDKISSAKAKPSRSPLALASPNPRAFYFYIVGVKKRFTSEIGLVSFLFASP